MNEDEKLQALLNAGPSLSSLKTWSEINGSLSLEGLPSINSKLEIGQHDLYLKVAWWEARIVRIDLTLSRGRDPYDDLPKSAKQVSLETTRFDLAKSWVESECRMASTLLQAGVVGIGYILDEWIGVEGYPSGYCRQLPGLNPETGEKGPTFQKGPLHAAALYIKKRLVEWTEEMEGE